jgi:hypothetical protein
VGFYVAFILNYSKLAGSFEQSGWGIYIAFLVAFFVLAPLEVADMFISRTTFDQRGIETRNLVFRKSRWSYEEVDKVETAITGHHIRITFFNGRSIKVWSGDEGLERVISLLLDQCGPRLTKFPNHQDN